MERGIDNGIMLGDDLDGSSYAILNLGGLVPVPPSLVSNDDYRLSDPRLPLDGSVTNDSVADDAGIVQSKLSLNGDIPLNYLGTDDAHAAQGSLVQPLIEKDQPNGYVSLGIDNKLPTGSTALNGTGTLHEINFEFPINEVTTLPDETGTVRTFTGYWAAQNPESWLGNFSGDTAQPTFNSQTLPADMVPGFDASRIISGTIEVDRLPAAVGVGVDHTTGAVPIPGSDVSGPTTELPTDYLGRDMEYHPMVTLVSYQPQLSSPSISIQSYYSPPPDITIPSPIDSAYVNITFNDSSMTPVNLFYSVSGSAFTEIVPGTLPLLIPVGEIVQAYAAKVGYNNSDITIYTVGPNPAPPPLRR